MVGGQETAIALWKNWRIKLYLAVLFLSLGSIVFLGLDFGMDFRGGTMIQLRLDEEVEPTTMSTMVTILSERLNGFGLKDISVRPHGSDYITVEVSASDSSTVEQLKNLLSQQGRFEAVIEGEAVLFSEDITGVVTNPQQGYGYVSSTQQWQVPFTLSREGSDRFARAAEGKCDDMGECERIYMFIDRPRNAAIVVPNSIYSEESAMRMDPDNPSSYPIDIGEFEQNTLTPIYVSDAVTPELLESLEGYAQVIVPADAYDISLFGEMEVSERQKGAGYWLWGATNLKSILFLTPGVTGGEPIREATITGGAKNMEEAMHRMTEIVVILRSGRLPVGLSIASTNSVSPTLGENFLNDSVLMGLLALLAVAAVLFARYRDLKLTGLMMMASVSGLVMILGSTALIRHQLDIASMAGIIASIGMGVDQFIIMTDEVKRGERGEMTESVIARIKRAFRIIIAAAATLTAAMVPLMTLGLGILRGFAITTLIGLAISVFVLRPAIGKAIEKLM